VTAKRIYQGLFALILIAFAAYGWNFIQRTAIVLPNGERMHALFDDAMISMQFAKNWAHGDGIVWNAGGERVEGYSNPLWVLLMAGIHLLPLPLTQTSLYLKIASLVFLFINLIVVKKLADEITENKIAPLIAVFLTAFYFSLNNWSLQGMEVGFEALLLNAGLLLALRAWKQKRFSYWPYVLFGLAVLLRMDAAAPAIAATALLAGFDEKRRKEHIWWGAGAVFGTLLLLTVFRVAYYGEWLPNTYLLKLGGISTVLRISLGLRRLGDFIWNSNWLLFSLPLLVPLLDRRKLLWPLYAAIVAQVAYSVYVGGDAWEHVGGANRFIATVMPLFFVIFAHALGLLQELVLRSVKSKHRWVPATGDGVLALIAIVSLFSFNNLLVQRPVAKWTLQDKPVFTDSVERYALIGLALKDVTTADATVAVVTAGNVPYFSERASIDLLGKIDPVIAAGPARINSSLFQPGNYRPGHNKWNYAYSIGELQPDVVAQIWDDTQDEVAPYLVNYEMRVVEGFPFYFRIDSENVLWDLLPEGD
jgi:arabinofuranosyltransferase